jgi:hypothetical protein
MLACANCGQENPDVARFCLACGAPVVDSGVAREERKIVTVLFAELVGFTSRAEQLESHLLSFPDMALALLTLRREGELLEVAGKAKLQTKWIAAAKALVLGDFQHAAEIYDEAGSLPDAAFARLRAAEALIVDGRRVEGDPELQRALAFYRSVDATACIREGEALLARTA